MNREVIKDFGDDYVNRSGKILWEKIFNRILLTDEDLEKYKNYIPWDYFIISQPINSEQLKKYSSYFNWEMIFKYQCLSSEDILRYYEKVGLLNALHYQHFTPEVIYEVESRDSSLLQDRTWNKFLLKSQILPENFLLENINRFYAPDILITQRITSKIKEVLLGYFNIIDEYTKRSNLLYRTDIGKDWFIGYAKNHGSKFNPRYYMYDSRTEILTGKYGLLKVRVFYNDYISKWEFKKVDIIREIGSVDSLTKRV